MPLSIVDRSSKKVDATNDEYCDVAMQKTQDNAKSLTSSLRTKSSTSSSRSGRVSFTEDAAPPPPEPKKTENPPPPKRVPSKRRNQNLRNGGSLIDKENEGTQTPLQRNAEKDSRKEIPLPRQEASHSKRAETPPRKSFMSGIGKRLSSRFGEKRKGFVKVPENVLDDEDERSEDDPVMTIFESRNTQRVRWSLGGSDAGGPEKEQDISPEKHSGVNIKQFMSRALFGSKSNEHLEDEIDREVASVAGSVAGSLIWESAETPTGPEVIHTTSEKVSGAELTLSFAEDPKARALVVKLLNKARRAEHVHFRYEYAVKCYVKALNVLKKANYPNDHPTVMKTVNLLNSAHHVLSSYNNSANIVKMGIKNEDSGELVRALKMYTIAYRIRRDNLSRDHPSLVVLLNMLGSIQIKRGELKEAMQIYELALKDSQAVFNGGEADIPPPIGKLLAKSVTYREMGTIHELWGNIDEALDIYHKSLQCVSEWKEAVRVDDESTLEIPDYPKPASSLDCSIENVHLSRTSMDNGNESERGEMEVFLGPDRNATLGVSNEGNIYEPFFPARLEEDLGRTKSSQGVNSNAKSNRHAHADMDLALTLHQIAQLHRCQGEFSKALDAYEVALRGMKVALGKHHPNVAAVLGNIGNLQKEMGDLDAAYKTYQEVLGIESYRLGLSHPDVAITLHNIATIDAARGNYEHSLQLYRKVIGLQKMLFGEDHLSVSVTAACMGDVYEKIGQIENSLESFEEAVRIKSAALGRHSLDVARLLHKLGKLAFLKQDFHLADSFMARAILIYRLNKIGDDHEWMFDANRDSADIDAALAMGRGRHYEV